MTYLKTLCSWSAIMLALALLIVPAANAQDYNDDGAPPHGMSMTASSLKQRLDLSDEQAGKLRDLRRDYLKQTVMQSAKIRVAELELSDLLDADKLDASRIEKKVKEMESLRGDLTLSRVRFLLKAADFMTPEQFAKFRAMTTRRMGSSGHPPMGMMGKDHKGGAPSPHGSSGSPPHGSMPSMMNPHD